MIELTRRAVEPAGSARTGSGAGSNARSWAARRGAERFSDEYAAPPSCRVIASNRYFRSKRTHLEQPLRTMKYLCSCRSAFSWTRSFCSLAMA
jgi:hypothetical protein